MNDQNKPVISSSTIIAMLTPYIIIASSALVSWLFTHVGVLNIFGLGQSDVAHAIAGSIVFVLTAVLAYVAAHFHWLPVVITRLDRRRASKHATPTDPPASATTTTGTSTMPLGPNEPRGV